MAPNKGASSSKAASKLAKKAKQVNKAAKKEVQAIKSTSKGKGREDDEDDLELILERYQQEMRASALVSVTTLEAPPPPRVNALLLPSPSTISAEPASNHLYLIFGEYFDGSRATFYSSTLRYDIVKDEWREYKSAEGPAPRSGAAGVGLPGLGEGGGILIFGGEYATPTQTSFHHYKDLWLFNIKNHTWEKIETRKGPSGRSGHRMVLWKQYVILFGGFIDVGVKTNYLSDLWIFDTEEFKWKQIENIDRDRAPGPRSGFSLIPCPEGAILHGGYRKEYVKGTRPKGVALDDTWLLRMDTDLSQLKWEKRRKIGFAPSLRSGCSMTYWGSKGMGVLFGGVLDEEKDEESMESTFYNDLFAYNPQSNGRWVSLNLKKRKKGGGRRKKAIAVESKDAAEDIEVDVSEDEGFEPGDAEEDGDEENAGNRGETDRIDVEMTSERYSQDPAKPSVAAKAHADEEEDADPARSVPLTRYSAQLAIVKNTLFIYGGMYETTSPAREYTLDDFVTLNLEKLDRYVHLRGTGLEELEWRGSDDEDGSESDDDDEDEDDESDEEEDEEEEEEEEGDSDAEVEMDIDHEGLDEEGKAKRHAALSHQEKESLRLSALEFQSQALATRAEEETLSTPLPGETLRLYYERSRAFWAGKAWEAGETAGWRGGKGGRGKGARREGFVMAKTTYDSYKPLLEEIERIQREAEVEGVVGKRGGAGGAGTPVGAGDMGRGRR